MGTLNSTTECEKYLHLMRITQKDGKDVEFVGCLGIANNSLVGFAYEAVTADSGPVLRLVSEDSLLVLDPKRVEHELIEDYVLPYKATSLRGLQSTRAKFLSLPVVSRRSIPIIEASHKEKESERQESMKLPHIRYLVVSLRPVEREVGVGIDIQYDRSLLDENASKVLYLKFR